MHRHLFAIALSLFAAASPLPGAAADIYGYVDAEGVAHFSDVPDSAQYRLVLREGAGETRSAPPRPAGRGAAYAEAIRREAELNRLDPLLLDAIIHVESGHDPGAISPRGAAGLMQLMPATAKRYGIADPLRADHNIRAGARYLRDLMTLFDDDLNLALAAYNAGENAVLRHNRQIPPYAETRRYVPLVLRRYAALQQASRWRQ